MLQLQQILSWRSMFRSKMGEATPPQPQGGFEQMIPMSAIAQAQVKKLGMFKKPWPVLPIQVTLPARGVSPAGSATSSMQPGATTATYIIKMKAVHVESHSPDMQDRNRTEHQSQDLTKKMLHSLV